MKNTIKLSMVASLLLVNAINAEEVLEPIIVTSASQTEQSIKDVTSNVQIITGEELEEKKITTVLEALNYNGISISQNGGLGQSSSFFMGGMSSGNTLVLVDGVSYNDPTTTEGQAQLEHLMVNDIERIEIIHGAQSGIYGANAVAGVINIITKEATKSFKAHATVEYGSFNTKKINTSVSQRFEKFSYYLGVNYIDSDGFSASFPTGTSLEDYEDDGYTNRTINGKFGYQISENDKLIFNITDIKADVEYDDYFGGPNSVGYEINQHNQLYKLTYQHDFNANDYIRTSYSKTKFDKLDPMGWTTHFKGFNDEIAADAKVTYNTTDFVLVGFNKLKSEDELGAHALESEGFYITNSNRFDKLVLTESLRRDDYDLFDGETTGKIGFKYEFTDDVSISANYGTAYKTPSLYQLYDSWSGNASLKPEKTRSKDISVSYKDFQLTYFMSSVTDLIDWAGVYTQVAGTSKFSGYKLSYQKEVLSDWYVSLHYTKLDAKNKDGKDLARRPDETLNFGVDYYGIDKLHIGAYGEYIGERYDALGKTGAQTGKYTVVNLVTDYEISKSTSMYFKIENFFDREYQLVDTYAAAPRSLSVGLKTTF